MKYLYTFLIGLISCQYAYGTCPLVAIDSTISTETKIGITTHLTENKNLEGFALGQNLSLKIVSFEDFTNHLAKSMKYKKGKVDCGGKVCALSNKFLKIVKATLTNQKEMPPVQYFIKRQAAISGPHQDNHSLGALDLSLLSLKETVEVETGTNLNYYVYKPDESNPFYFIDLNENRLYDSVKGITHPYKVKQ